MIQLLQTKKKETTGSPQLSSSKSRGTGVLIKGVDTILAARAEPVPPTLSQGGKTRALRGLKALEDRNPRFRLELLESDFRVLERDDEADGTDAAKEVVAAICCLHTH